MTAEVNNTTNGTTSAGQAVAGNERRGAGRAMRGGTVERPAGGDDSTAYEPATARTSDHPERVTKPGTTAAGPTRAEEEVADGPASTTADDPDFDELLAAVGHPIPRSTAPASLTMRQVQRLGLLGLLTVLVSAAAGVGTSLLMPVTYAARASVLYPLTQEQPTGFLREDRNLTTQLVLLHSRRVLDPVAAANGMRVEDLEGEVVPTLDEGSEILELEVRDTSRERAVALAGGVIQSYLAVANENRYTASLGYINDELANVTSQLRNPNVSRAETDALIQRQQALFTQKDDISIGAPQARVVVAPYPVTTPVSLKPLYAGLTGAASGLLIAAVIVTLLARRWLRRR